MAATLMVMKTGIIMAAVLTPLQIFIGDLHGLNTLEHQPAKIAAMEAVWDTERGAAFTLIGLPDEETRSTDYAVKIPYAGSLILTHSLDGEVKGLNEYEGAHPPVAVVFWSFRVMLGMGVLMLLVSWWTAFQFIRGNAISGRLLLVLSAMTFSGWVATLAGWYVTEIGRQPWIIYGLVRTADVARRSLKRNAHRRHAAGLRRPVCIPLLVSYIQALRYLASKPAQSLSLLQDYPGIAAGGNRADGRVSLPSRLLCHGRMGLALLLYVILDGFDLGVGLLLPLATDAEKDTMIASYRPLLGRQ